YNPAAQAEVYIFPSSGGGGIHTHTQTHTTPQPHNTTKHTPTPHTTQRHTPTREELIIQGGKGLYHTRHPEHRHRLVKASPDNTHTHTHTHTRTHTHKHTHKPTHTDPPRIHTHCKHTPTLYPF